MAVSEKQPGTREAPAKGKKEVTKPAAVQSKKQEQPLEGKGDTLYIEGPTMPKERVGLDKKCRHCKKHGCACPAQWKTHGKPKKKSGKAVAEKLTAEQIEARKAKFVSTLLTPLTLPTLLTLLTLLS
jgi:hypothetical protein